MVQLKNRYGIQRNGVFSHNFIRKCKTSNKRFAPLPPPSPPPNFQCISYGMTQTFSCKYCKGEELLSFRESHQESITCPTYNSDIKLLCSRDHRTRLLLSVDAGENSPLTENSPWREHLRGKVVRNHSIRRSTNAPQLGKDVIITILSTCGMHYPKNGTCNITILSIV